MTLTYDIILDALKNSHNLSYARYGDGELNCILGKQGANCDGHEYFTDMGIALKRILESKPDYYIGLQTLGMNQNKGNVIFDKLYKLNTWQNNEIFSHASINGRINEIKTALTNRRVIQVANETLKPLKLADVFIQIPKVNCWLKKDETLNAIKDNLLPNDVILYSASMPTKYFIDQLYREHLSTITQLDMGSVWDVYVGNNSRSYMNRILENMK
jgi:hypothetical protein